MRPSLRGRPPSLCRYAPAAERDSRSWKGLLWGSLWFRRRSAARASTSATTSTSHRRYRRGVHGRAGPRAGGSRTSTDRRSGVPAAGRWSMGTGWDSLVELLESLYRQVFSARSPSRATRASRLWSGGPPTGSRCRGRSRAHGVRSPQPVLPPGWVPGADTRAPRGALLGLAGRVRGAARGHRRIRKVRYPSTTATPRDSQIALPALLRRGLGPSFFVVAARWDQPGSLSSATSASSPATI